MLPRTARCLAPGARHLASATVGGGGGAVVASSHATSHQTRTFQANEKAYLDMNGCRFCLERRSYACLRADLCHQPLEVWIRQEKGPPFGVKIEKTMPPQDRLLLDQTRLTLLDSLDLLQVKARPELTALPCACMASSHNLTEQRTNAASLTGPVDFDNWLAYYSSREFKRTGILVLVSRPFMLSSRCCRVAGDPASPIQNLYLSNYHCTILLAARPDPAPALRGRPGNLCAYQTFAV